MEDARRQLNLYRSELNSFRTQYGGGYALPHVKFFQFGMGNRNKLVYRDGILLNSLSGDTLRIWDVKEEIILPPDYAVFLMTKKGEKVCISEDQAGVWINDRLGRHSVVKTDCRLKLPDFKGNRFPMVLKVLHHEILINILDSKPLPNFFVYKKPWRRDGAMMAMCLEKTGNLALIKDWVLSLDNPYDHNNGSISGKPENEADNLGQTLYLLSFFTNQHHPLVAKILEEAKKFEKKVDGKLFISGRSDFHEVPVYQTKWMKFGLKSLKMNDPYQIPSISDDYSSLFWWDYTENYLRCDEYSNDFYPYLGWARDHFKGTITGPVSNQDYPLSWETKASEADYSKLSVIDQVYVDEKTSAPHTWHASEMFLTLIQIQNE
ncbi:MAG: hypothetical protein GZ094_15945 [Mariniphaga sp.]|nr:hypothetical protein [Mariniphaga sp.]